VTTRFEDAAGEVDDDRHLIGSVMSSWNSFNVSGRTVIDRASGCRVWDIDGTERIDWVMGWGSLVLGHDPTPVLDALRGVLEVGFGYQYESPINHELADRICALMPSMEKVRLCNSGLEATQYAIRVARARTGRSRVLKFEGHFHGLNDFLLWGVDGSPVLGERRSDGTIDPIPGSPGLPDQLADLVVIVPFNDLEAVDRALARRDIAAVILEPVALNIGCVYPQPGFLEHLRVACTDTDTLLVFDEVLTGFRAWPGGAQAAFEVTPDLTCLGKALGCGVPGAAVGGSAEHMAILSPVGDLDMAGTNTARRLISTGILAALDAMEATDAWARLRQANDRMVEGCQRIFADRGIPAHVQGYGGRIGIHFGSETAPRDFRQVVTEWNGDFHRACYAKAHDMGTFGFLLPLGICPEPITLSVAHDDATLDRSLDILDQIVASTPYISPSVA
jgi:glutamate-1-semialdehyde 2,1-aminomutase